MSRSGDLAAETCGCPQNESTDTTGIDLLRIRLEEYTAPPASPSDLTATPTSTEQVRLDRADNSDNECKFEIQRKAGAGGTWSEIA